MLTKIEIFVIDKVKEIRLLHKLSQADLAFKINLSPGFIGRIESFQYNSKYNLNHINQISKAFNISPRELLPENYFE